MRLRLVAALYGTWLFLLVIAFYVTGGHNENSLQYAVMAGLIPVGAQLLVLGFDPRGHYPTLLFSIAMVLIVAVSYLANPDRVLDWTPVIYTVNVIFLFSVGIIVAGCPDQRLAAAAGAAYSVITALFLIQINLSGLYVWGRLSAGNLEPNFWGLIGLSVAVGALGFGRLVFCLPVAAIGCWTMFDASSRSAIVGFAIAVCILLLRGARDLRGPRLYLALAGVAGCAVLGAVYLSSFMTTTLDLGNTVLKLHDPYRGIDTGFTGRSELWNSTFDLWLKHPLFGVGFRKHEEILDFPSHNGYLAMLADTGIFGFLFYCGMLVLSLRASWRMQDPTQRRFVMVIIVSYAVMSLFERRAINTGNPLGFLIIIACFFALEQEARRRRLRIGVPLERRLEQHS